MKKASFSLMGKTLNLDQIEGKYSAFAKVPYALTLRTSKPLAEDGYGVALVDGVVVSQGVGFLMDSIIKLNCLMIPVGEVANEYDREYTLTLSKFVAADGTPFKERSFRFRTRLLQALTIHTQQQYSCQCASKHSAQGEAAPLPRHTFFGA